MEQNLLKEALETLKEAGVRITIQRQAILEYLIKSMSHPTADEIYKSLEDKFTNMSVATVYNNLRVFREVGLVNELTYGDTSSRFDLVTTDHYHVICEKCGEMVDFYYPGLVQLEHVASNATGFKVGNHRMEFYGICPDCADQEIH